MDIEPFENIMPNTITFIAAQSSDMECFCWKLASLDEAKRLLGKEKYAQERKAEIKMAKESAKDQGTKFDEARVDYYMTRLYPNMVLDKLGCVNGKNYKFTVTVEEIE